MPVKNVKRKTNDGFEGVITGLNDKEKEIIASSIVEANPIDTATATLNKLKVADVTYNVGGDRCLHVECTFMQTSGEYIYNTFTLSDEDKTKILNNEIDVISGTYKVSADDEKGTSFTAVRDSIVEYEGQKMGFFVGSDITAYDTFSFKVYGFQVAIQPEMNLIMVFEKRLILSPAVYPVDFSSKTYTFKTVNSVPTWVDTSVGTQYFEDINVGGVSLDDKINSAINSAITSTLEANY